MDHPKPCQPATAQDLYWRLECYRNFIPAMLDMSEAQYAATAEGQRADQALAQYRSETGALPSPKPSWV